MTALPAERKSHRYLALHWLHMSVIASNIAGKTNVCSTACSGWDQRTYQSSALLTFVSVIYRWPADFPHKGPVMQNTISCHDVIVNNENTTCRSIWASDGHNSEIIWYMYFIFSCNYACFYLCCISFFRETQLWCKMAKITGLMHGYRRNTTKKCFIRI